MPILKFTKLNLDKIPFEDSGQKDYFDTETKGLGLRVGTASKTFFVKVDVPDPSSKTGKRSAKKTLGRFGGDYT